MLQNNAEFILGSDEACLMASPTGQVKVFGDKLKDTHEKIVKDSCVSISIVRTAAFRPTHFLTAGAKVKAGYTPNWLQRHGAAPGSGIVATPTAFMTEAALLEIAEERAKGIRAMPVIKDHPEWWVLDIMDGFVPHFMNPKALAIYWAHKIRQGNEAGNTSQVNQLFDQEVTGGPVSRYGGKGSSAEKKQQQRVLITRAACLRSSQKIFCDQPPGCKSQMPLLCFLI